MKPWRLFILSNIFGTACLPLIALAQVPDGGSNTYVNATNAFVDVTIGTNGSFTMLTLGNNAMFTNAGSGVIGLNATARSNEVRLISPTARWFVGNQIHVGSNGSFNRLLVSNGATVRAFNGNLALGIGSNNLAMVTGPGSVWSNANIFYVGFNGSGNQLVVSNGGALYNNSAILGVNSGGFSNQAIVTGSGSLWSNRADLSIGFNGVGTRLEVRDGGYVRNRVGSIGNQVGATNIFALVTGPGSTWSNAAELYIGAQGPANQMTVEAGGTVRSAVGYVGANFTASNNLALITGAGSMWSNEVDLVIGSFSGHNRLRIDNGGLVRNARNGVIGPTANGNANSALVTDAGSQWLVGGALYVGSNSALNQLVITNGGQVTSIGAVSGNVGWGPSASNNLALVTGAGSVWSNAGYFYLGVNARGNHLVISNGGVVLADQSSVGSNIPASNTLVTVTGPGSRWETKGLYVGFSSAANRLEVNNGGVVGGFSSTLSANVSSSNNLMLVTGPGSALTNMVSLYVGQYGPGNQLVVTNGGRAFVGETMVVGAIDSSINNRVLVDGGTLQVAYSATNAILDVRRGTNVFNAGVMDVDRLLMTNSLSRFEFNGGTLITRGAAISNSYGLVMGTVPTTPAIWAVHHGAGEHALGVPLVVGLSAPFTQLLITNGTVMRSSNYGLTGASAGSVSNLVLVSQTNSALLLRDLYIGYSGNHNWLVVSNGGFLGADYMVVGGEGNTTNCEAVVTGQGSVISNALGLQIGSSGSFNRVRIENAGTLLGIVQVGRTTESIGNVLSVTGAGSRVDALTNLNPNSIGFDGAVSRMEISAGGAVIGYEGEIGRSVSSSNNLVVVTGAGSVWSNASDLRIGVSGAGNRLEVSHGAVLANYEGFVGYGTFGSNNQVWVTGSGSTWTNGRELAVGLNGKGNQLVISNGGTVFTYANKYVGYNDGGISNTVVITDPGSAWLGDDSLYIGADSSFNRLFVRNGGRLVSGLGNLGSLAGANANQVLVTDGGSVWTNQQELTVGDYGSANAMVVSNGAVVFSSEGFIGRSDFASSNAAAVIGPGTRWLINSNLYVGSNGSFNRLIIAEGAFVVNAVGTIGRNLSSVSNVVLVTGAGTVWSNSNDLDVGNFGRGNQLVVSNGGQVVTMGSATIGSGFGGHSNSAVVTESGTRWRIKGNLVVGGESVSNVLLIAKGGQVISDNGSGSFGLSPTSRGNKAVVTGSGSLWSNQFDLYVGFAGEGNLLEVSDGGVVHNNTGLLGIYTTSSNNTAIVTGLGSLWNNLDLFVGYVGGGGQLVVSNGGSVYARNSLIVGRDATSTNNRVIIDGGTQWVNNGSGSARLDVRHGTNIIHAGLIDVDRLLVTNALGAFEFDGGRLITGETINSNGRTFTVGNGTNVATLQLRHGLHNFADGLNIPNQGLLIGVGTVIGTVNVMPGGVLSPGTAIGALAFTNSPFLQGVTVMEISRDGATLTNDQIHVPGALAYGGSLVVSNSGPTPLASGDRFTLFSASAFSGEFTNVLLPPLAVGLRWTNKLSIDGSIEVVPYVPPPVTLSLQRSNGVFLVSWPTNGADYCLETTFDLSPPAVWQTISAGITTNEGSFVLSFASTVAKPKQFFRLAFPCSIAPVTLALSISNNLVTVSWPSNSYRLETTYSLSTPITWQPINSGITDTNGLQTFSLTNSPTVTNQFFRLASP